jgi:hypothetical protein
MYTSILTPLDGSKTAEWKLLLEQPGKIDNFSFSLSTDLQDCHGFQEKERKDDCEEPQCNPIF